MSTMYFMKFNFNSNIYEIYNDESLREKLLKEMFVKINEEVEFIDENKKLNRFINLIKSENEFAISGRVVLAGEDDDIRYDRVKRDIVETTVPDKATYIIFYFDLSKEIIAFVPKRDFKHVMFKNIFKKLIELCMPEIEVELTLEKNVNRLRELIKEVSHIQQVEIDIIPPNGDKEEYDALFSTTSNDIKETAATRFIITLLGVAKKSINAGSKYLEKMVNAVGRGYGDIKVVGKTSQGDRTFFSSDEKAPFTKTIPDIDKENLIEFPNYAKAGITELIISKPKIE